GGITPSASPRRHPLLGLRPPAASSLVLSCPGIAAVWQRLVQQGKPCSFWLPPLDEEATVDILDAESPEIELERLQSKPDEIVCEAIGRRQLLRVLTNLYRRAGAEYRERGLHILHVAFGVLEWRDQDNDETVRSA